MGKFIALMGIDGHYYFNLLASNGRVIFSSEAYHSDIERDKRLHTVQDHAFDLLHYERRISRNGEYYFVMKTMDGEIIGTSQMYISEASRDNAIEAVKNNARDAEVEIA